MLIAPFDLWNAIDLYDAVATAAGGPVFKQAYDLIERGLGTIDDHGRLINIAIHDEVEKPL
jgi:hypothetical protein